VREILTKYLPDVPDDVAPDGSEVRLLLGLGGGGMAHFQLAPNRVSKAVTHRTVEEIWYFLTGRGQMWRKRDGLVEMADLSPGVCVTIPLGTHFQFRCQGDEPLSAVAVTMPPWPGKDEAMFVTGPWEPSKENDL
jgi:mannose-6-phosphate isomerase-like protein (cupin superfamily)